VETQLCIQLELAAKPLVFEDLASQEPPLGPYNPWQLPDFRQRSIGIRVEEKKEGAMKER
jgi:hypothetical protein